jgi:hypothetical protein
VVLSIGAFGWGIVTYARMDDLEDQNAMLSADATAQALVAAEAGAERDALSEAVESQEAVLQIALQPDARSTQLAGTAMAPDASGSCVWSLSTGSGALVARGLPPTTGNHAYVMWIVYENEWLDAGHFTVGDDGEARLVMTRWGRGGNEDLGDFGGFAVTLEPMSGTPDGHGETVMTSAPAE